jgi:uncharacterized MAPEG superfamily protein
MYVMAYVSGLSNARSLAWALAFAVNIGILFAGYR